LKQKAPKIQERTPNEDRDRLRFHRQGQNTWPAVLSSSRTDIVLHFVFILYLDALLILLLIVLGF
jgi:hypothetical protein